MESKTWYIGLKGGIGLSKINDINHTVISSFYDPSTYSTQIQMRKGYTIGIFTHWKYSIKGGISIAIQPEISYTQQGSLFEYLDQDKSDYGMMMKYNYLSISPTLRLYVWDGLCLTFIPQLELIISPTNISYSSNYDDIS